MKEGGIINLIYLIKWEIFSMELNSSSAEAQGKIFTQEMYKKGSTTLQNNCIPRKDYHFEYTEE